MITVCVCIEVEAPAKRLKCGKEICQQYVYIIYHCEILYFSESEY